MSQFLDADHGMRTFDTPQGAMPPRYGNQAWYDRIERTIKASRPERDIDWLQIELAIIIDRAVRHDEGYWKTPDLAERDAMRAVVKAAELWDQFGNQVELKLALAAYRKATR